LFDKSNRKEIEQAGYILGKTYAAEDYSITQLKLAFVNPSTRNDACSQILLAEVKGKTAHLDKIASR
jgi:hypothetical protein